VRDNTKYMRNPENLEIRNEMLKERFVKNLDLAIDVLKDTKPETPDGKINKVATILSLIAAEEKLFGHTDQTKEAIKEIYPEAA